MHITCYIIRCSIHKHNYFRSMAVWVLLCAKLMILQYCATQSKLWLKNLPYQMVELNLGTNLFLLVDKTVQHCHTQIWLHFYGKLEIIPTKRLNYDCTEMLPDPKLPSHLPQCKRIIYFSQKISQMLRWQQCLILTCHLFLEVPILTCPISVAVAEGVNTRDWDRKPKKWYAHN